VVNENSSKSDSLFFVAAALAATWSLTWITYLLVITH
jgi:hypothetical protein